MSSVEPGAQDQVSKLEAVRDLLSEALSILDALQMHLPAAKLAEALDSLQSA